MWRRSVAVLVVGGCVSATAKPVREGLYVINATRSQFATAHETEVEADARAGQVCPHGYVIRDRFVAQNGRIAMTIECNTSGKITVAPKP